MMTMTDRVRSPQNATESQYRRIRTAPARPLTERLAERGIRLTAKRRAILRILEEADQHLDAAGLLKEAQKQLDIDRATVYRTLDLLKRQGLIDELDLMHLRGEMHYYEARSDGQEHFHFVCFGCGRIEEVHAPLFAELKQQVAAQRRVQIEVARLEIGGYCEACAAKRAARKEADELEPVSA